MKPVIVRPSRLDLLRKAVLAIPRGLIELRVWRLRKLAGMDIGRDTRISLRADLD